METPTGAEITIHNVIGDCLARQTILRWSTEIDLSEQTPGLYILVIEHDGNHKVHRVVKQ